MLSRKCLLSVFKRFGRFHVSWHFCMYVTKLLTFRIQKIWSFLTFIDTFHTQRNWSFPCFLTLLYSKNLVFSHVYWNSKTSKSFEVFKEFVNFPVSWHSLYMCVTKMLTFRIQKIWLFLTFIATFRTQRNWSFPCFLTLSVFKGIGRFTRL